MIKKVSEMLKDAKEKGYVVPAFNVFNYESTKWVVEACEEENYPVILQFYPAMSKFISFEDMVAIMKSIAKNAKVPVGIHLDHAPSFETAIAGINAGFDSIMIDGSQLPLKENIALTKKVVEIARIFNVDVEAELGLVGRAENKDDFLDPNKYTSVQEAVEFIEETKVDSLAVSIGNSHGNYVCTPNLDIKRLSEINNAIIETPLVLHGGSGIPSEQVVASIPNGIAKMNIATELGIAFYSYVKESIDSELSHKLAILGTMMTVKPKFKEFIKEKLKMLNPKCIKFRGEE